MAVAEIKSILDALSAAESGAYDETQTKQFLIFPILAVAGWNLFDKNEVWPELKVGRKKFDITLCKKPKQFEIVIEAKRLKSNLSQHKKQLLSYAFESGLPIAILTNGRIWWIFLSTMGNTWENRFVSSYNIANTQQREELISILCKDKVQSGEAFQQLKQIYESKHQNFESSRSVYEFLATLLSSSSVITTLATEFAAYSGQTIENAKKQLLASFKDTRQTELKNQAFSLTSVGKTVHLLDPKTINIYRKPFIIQEQTNAAYAASVLVLLAQYSSQALRFSKKLKSILNQYYKAQPVTVLELVTKYHLHGKFSKELCAQRLKFHPKARYSETQIESLFVSIKSLTPTTASKKETPKATPTRPRRL